MSGACDPVHEVDVSSDGTTVWVNAADGSCIGRFSKRFGMDVHRTATEMMKGLPECLACSHGGPIGPAQWQQFRDAMSKHYGIEIAQDLVRF